MANTTILSEDIKLRGKLHLKESLVIHGTLQGYIQSPGELQIGSAARIEADIDADEVCVDGYVQGNVFAAKKLSLRKNAQLVGDIRTSELEVEKGARFSGNCIMD